MAGANLTAFGYLCVLNPTAAVTIGIPILLPAAGVGFGMMWHGAGSPTYRIEIRQDPIWLRNFR